MIKKLTIRADVLDKNLILSISAVDENNRNVCSPNNEIYGYIYMKDATIIKKICQILNIEVGNLNPKYNSSELISHYFLNSGNGYIKFSVQNFIKMQYLNNKYWGQKKVGTMIISPSKDIVNEAVQNLPHLIAKVQKRNEHIFIEKNEQEIMEFLKYKQDEMNSRKKDMETLYGLEKN